MNAYVQIAALAKEAAIINRDYLTESELIIVLDALIRSLGDVPMRNEVILCHA